MSGGGNGDPDFSGNQAGGSRSDARGAAGTASGGSAQTVSQPNGVDPMASLMRARRKSLEAAHSISETGGGSSSVGAQLRDFWKGLKGGAESAPSGTDAGRR